MHQTAWLPRGPAHLENYFNNSEVIFITQDKNDAEDTEKGVNMGRGGPGWKATFWNPHLTTRRKLGMVWLHPFSCSLPCRPSHLSRQKMRSPIFHPSALEPPARRAWSGQDHLLVPSIQYEFSYHMPLLVLSLPPRNPSFSPIPPCTLLFSSSSNSP